MPSPEIDSERPGNPTGTSTVNILPPNVRALGIAPDLSQCIGGDLILFRSRSPGLVQKQIARTQQRIGLGTEHACWPQAAVFLYGDYMVEAVPGRGVITRSLYADIPNRILLVRRRPNLPDEDRYKIALCAQRMLGQRYNFRTAISAALRAETYAWDRLRNSVAHSAIVCSKVYYDAHVEITRVLLKDCPLDELVTPAHLSATSDLIDIDVPWLKVP